VSPVKEFDVGVDSTGHEQVIVKSDGINVSVNWGCVTRRFTVEDLRDRLANLDLSRGYEAWLFDRDSHGTQYTAGIANGDFAGWQHHGIETTYRIDYSKFREALDKAVAVKPSVADKAKSKLPRKGK
jgi:hypothetical protein